MNKEIIIIANLKKTADFFLKKLLKEKESDSKEKVQRLLDYSYCWYLGLRGKNIFEEEVDTQDFLNNIWNCYGEFSAEKLLKMITREYVDICQSSRYIHLRDRPLFVKSMVDGVVNNIQMSHHCIQGFYSYHNKEIEKYLPPNVVLTISDNGLYEIVRFVAFDDNSEEKNDN